MPLCRGASGSVRTSVKMWSARWPAEVQIFCPLSTHWSPSSTPRKPMLERSLPAFGSRVALAPRVGARQDPRQVPVLLLVGAPLQQRVAEHLDAEDIVRPAGGHAGLGELLGDDHLLERRQPGAAVLGRPPRREVAGPRTASCATRLTNVAELVALERADATPVGGQLLGQEGLDLLAVGLGIGGVGRAHGVRLPVGSTASHEPV